MRSCCGHKVEHCDADIQCPKAKMESDMCQSPIFGAVPPSLLFALTPSLLCQAPQATPINPDHSQPCIVVPPHCILDGGQNHHQIVPSWPLGMWTPFEVT